MFEVGDSVGNYTILAHLRSGGMANLFLARREGAAGFKRHVAIKVVHSRHAEDEHLIRMFLDEALISARIDHPNVVHVEDLGQLDGTYFLVMEYVHGSSVAHLLKMLARMKRRLSPQVAVAIAAWVAEGLHAAHETTDDDGQLVHLVHRDVSPQNILLSHRGHVKLIDFGVAKARIRSEETNVAMLKGKVRYMPPEQATTGIVDRRSDVYSLGIVLWEMLTMRRLFTGKTEFEVLLKVRDPQIVPPSHFVPDIPPELDRVVLAALSRHPDDRPKNAKVFRRALARALPKSTTLDSAHLADLILSVVGDELEHLRHDLPKEVSRVLEAEQLRVALAEKEERVDVDEETTQSIVDVMTLHSELVAFEEDELDARPDVSAVFSFKTDGATRPGTPSAQSRSLSRELPSESANMSPSGSSALRSDETGARRAPTEDDAEPTMVGAVPPAVRTAMSNAGGDDYVVEQEESEEVPTLPRPTGPLQELLSPPALFAPPQGAPLQGATLRLRQRDPRLAWVAAGVGASFLFLLVVLVVVAARWALASSAPEPEAVPAGVQIVTPLEVGPAPDPVPPIDPPADRAVEVVPEAADAPTPAPRPGRHRNGIRRRR